MDVFPADDGIINAEILKKMLGIRETFIDHAATLGQAFDLFNGCFEIINDTILVGRPYTGNGCLEERKTDEKKETIKALVL